MISNNNKERTRNAEKGVTGFVIRNKKQFISVGALIISLALWGLIWALAAYAFKLDFIFPSPASAFKSFFSLLITKKFLTAVAGSMLRVILGYLIGIIFGALIAFAAHFMHPLKAFFAPIIKIARATPIASFILICVLWMKGTSTPVFIVFLMVFPIIYENVLTALEQTDKMLIEMATVYGFSRRKKLLSLYIPSVLPYFGSACISALGLAWKSGISAEVIVLTARSVGYYIYEAKQYFETETVFAWTIAVVLLSVGLEYLVKLIARLVSRRLGRRFSYAEKH